MKDREAEPMLATYRLRTIVPPAAVHPASSMTTKWSSIMQCATTCISPGMLKAASVDVLSSLQPDRPRTIPATVEINTDLREIMDWSYL